jgi:hypothetical protein
MVGAGIDICGFCGSAIGVKVGDVIHRTTNHELTMLRAFAKDGVYLAEAARRAGVTPHCAFYWSKKLGFTFGTQPQRLGFWNGVPAIRAKR